jgi:hypothetical protein
MPGDAHKGVLDVELQPPVLVVLLEHLDIFVMQSLVLKGGGSVACKETSLAIAPTPRPSLTMNRVGHSAPEAVRLENVVESSRVPEMGQWYPYCVIFQHIAVVVSEERRLED